MWKAPSSVEVGGGDLAEGPLLGGGGRAVVGVCASLRPFLLCIMTWLS